MFDEIPCVVDEITHKSFFLKQGEPPTVWQSRLLIYKPNSLVRYIYHKP